MRKLQLIIPILLVVLGASLLSYEFLSNKHEQDEIQNTIEEFKDSLNNTKPNIEVEWPSYTEEPEITPEPTAAPVVKKPDTIGVMYIPAINVEAPIGMGTTDKTIKTHIGQYSTLDGIDKEGGLAGFTAHSSRTGRCNHCYFERIEELSEGDLIQILSNDGHMYNYSVFYVCAYESKDLDYYYIPIEGKTTITLTTCTDGDPDVRTIVRAELIGIDQGEK